MNAGVDPNSGYWLGDDAANHVDETDADQATRINYLHHLNQSVSHIAGLIEGCHIRVWRDRDGKFELAPPVSTAQAFYVRDGQMDDLYFERSEWQMLFEANYPKTDLARSHQDDEKLTNTASGASPQTDVANNAAAPKIGRPLGSGSLKDEDEKLYPLIEAIISSKAGSSVTGAAWSLIEQIHGTGAPVNRVKRLVRGYKQRDRKGP